ncbi:ABC transporter substrate-binding protein [Arthrobacter sp. NPDC090010]|uniref:ABC transporter substrate-binding protein n=1 Tax=Arthrobacter sp. NPDC090010 TaxID=3363942 RepID=UPI0037F88E10
MHRTKRAVPGPASTTAGPSPSRKDFLLGGLSAAALLGLAACGSPAPASSGAAAAGFPAEVKHKFGTTVVPSAPRRVVSAGSTSQDHLLALGVIPVGITDWYGDQPDATWPWAHARLGDSHPTVLSAADGYAFEKIAALAPDLIVAANDGMKESDYKKLSAIAPTIAQSGEFADYAVPWDVQTLSIGLALGKKDEAQALVDGIKARFTAEKGKHPELVGKKAIFLQNAVYDGSVIAYQNGLSTEFLTELGLVVPAGLEKFAKDAQAFIPLEQLSVLNQADVLIWATEKDSDETALHKVPGFDQLNAVKAGRSLYTGGILSGAIYFTSPLSLPYVLDHLVPELSTALK